MSATTPADHAHEHAGPPAGLARWLRTTNHKDIGTLYLIFSFTMFLVGGVFALAIREMGRMENTMNCAEKFTSG